jgi:hypothetical protein
VRGFLVLLALRRPNLPPARAEDFTSKKTSRKGLASHSFKGTLRKLLKVLAVHILGQIDVLFVLATHIFFVSISL